MPEFLLMFVAFGISVTVSLYVLLSAGRMDAEERARRMPEAPAAPRLHTATPLWLEQLAELGFETFETDDTSFLATVKNVGYAIVVSKTHEDKSCSLCRSRALRTLGETGEAADMPKGMRCHEVTWIGWACGNCGNVDRSQRNPARFLGLMLADRTNVFDVLEALDYHSELPLENRVLACLQGREDQLEHRLRLSALLRAKVAASIQSAQIIPFKRKMRRPKGHTF